MLKKDNFRWSNEAKTAFETLKESMCTTPVLALPNFSKPFVLETDASSTGIGAVLSQEGPLRLQLLQILHDSPHGGHSGIQNTYQRIKATFYWPSLKSMVITYVQQCDICQRTKSEHQAKPGLLQPLPIPSKAWETITTDFIEGLPKSNSFNSILVVIDKFTKYAHFVPLSHPFTVLDVARKYLDNIYKLHGQPKVAISDRDKTFTSIFWKELMKQMGTTTLFSTAYHPEIDGQTERLNQCLEQFLRSICFLHPVHWAKWLSQAEFWYNTSYHSAISMTPFEALYGYKAPTMNWNESSLVQSVQEIIQQRQQMNKTIQQQLEKAQERMKHFADRHRTEREFQVGDNVYLKIQPYRQTSLALRKNLKLSARYYGPYEILQKIGAVAYKLKLPPLQKYIPSSMSAS
ncbi:hypothetical protein V6N11_065260 [Hibiscus sabdariffa]|uniref:Integrase catalytic domain-containing protein n=1 Tax=Hibiscus sabdariffa TaxID=183260 RepID=A0ABR2QGE9_9ROSI